MSTNQHDMMDKTVLITGANTGIGLATALGVAKMGARVLMVCRNKDRGAKALAQVKAKNGNSSVSLLIADLSSQASVRRLAVEVMENFETLDVLLNNAATIAKHRTLTEDGLEVQFAVNHLAYFLLTNLLMDLLKANAPARIINVSSQIHSGAGLDFDDLQFEKKYSRVRAYARTKLANVLFTYELARRLDGSAITANCLHPGLVSTNLLADIARIPRRLKVATRVAGLSAQAGAKTSIYLATSPEVEGVTGKYFVRGRVTDSSPASYDEEAAGRLWDISARLSGLEA